MIADLFITYWPFITLVIGCIGVHFITLNKILGKTSSIIHYYYLPLFLYLIHMFEEHGIDLMGRRFAFQADFCGILKKMTGSADCAATELVICFVNCGTVVILQGCAGLFGKTENFTTIKAASIGGILVNGFSHVFKALIDGGVYNPGFLTSILMFIPCSIYFIKQELKKNSLSKVIVSSIVMGVLLHVVLIFSLVFAMKGLIDTSLLPAIQILNGFIPLVVSILQRDIPSFKIKSN